MNKNLIGESGGSEKDFRERLRTEFGISSLVISIPTIARLLGVSPATLHGYIRKGSFFLPYRTVNKTPMVSVDDFVSWYRSGSDGMAVRARRS